MTKIMQKNGTELIIYQVGELKNLIENLTLKTDNFQEKIDKRVNNLEIWQAGEIEKSKGWGGVDLTKIILGAFAIVAAAIALLQSKFHL